MSPDKNFRMSKTTKRMLALMKGPDSARHHFRHMMIDAQLSEEAAKRAALKSKDRSSKETE